jgi:hypothetical protein
MSLIDTYQIATIGQNSYNTFTLASNGILVDVEIVDLPPIVVPPVEEPISGGGVSTWTGKEERKKTRKKIIVTATINGVKYKQEKIVEDKPKLSIKDVDVNVTESKSKRPIIEINVK